MEHNLPSCKQKEHESHQESVIIFAVLVQNLSKLYPIFWAYAAAVTVERHFHIQVGEVLKLGHEIEKVGQHLRGLRWGDCTETSVNSLFENATLAVKATVQCKLDYRVFQHAWKEP